MRIEQLFFSLISLVFSFALFVLGAFLFFVPYLPEMEPKIKNYFLSLLPNFSMIGISMMATSCVLVSIFGFFSRKKYLLIQMGEVAIYEKVIKEVIEKSLQELFPEKNVECEVVIHKKDRLEILANLPKILHLKESYFKKIEHAIALALMKCGIEREFLLNVRFS